VDGLWTDAQMGYSLGGREYACGKDWPIYRQAWSCHESGQSVPPGAWPPLVAVKDACPDAHRRRLFSQLFGAAPTARYTANPQSSRVTSSAFSTPARRPSLTSTPPCHSRRSRRRTLASRVTVSGVWARWATAIFRAVPGHMSVGPGYPDIALPTTPKQP
jgi:hypothetical protein